MHQKGKAPLLRDGFSLLEVILALAILAGAVAVLGELSRLGMRNAQRARELSEAQLLAESKMSEVAAGVEPAQSVDGQPLGTVADASASEWLYSIERTDLDDLGLLEIRVTVTKEVASQKRPTELTLVRWMVDPDLDSADAATDLSDLEGGEP